MEVSAAGAREERETPGRARSAAASREERLRPAPRRRSARRRGSNTAAGQAWLTLRGGGAGEAEVVDVIKACSAPPDEGGDGVVRGDADVTMELHPAKHRFAAADPGPRRAAPHDAGHG